MDEDLLKEIMWTDEEREEAMKDMSPDEKVAYFKSFYQRIVDDPEIAAQMPPGFLETLKAATDDMEKAFEKVKITARNAEFAAQRRAMQQAKFHRLADAALYNLPSSKKGH